MDDEDWYEEFNRAMLEDRHRMMVIFQGCLVATFVLVTLIIILVVRFT